MTEHKHQYAFSLASRYNASRLVRVDRCTGCTKTTMVPVVRCPRCNELRQNFANSQLQSREPCFVCGGEGFVVKRPPPACCCMGRKRWVDRCRPCREAKRGGSEIHVCEVETAEDRQRARELTG